METEAHNTVLQFYPMVVPGCPPSRYIALS
jgi:hypothetical protein